MDREKDSARIGRPEVVETGRRRRWSEDEKLKIVLESPSQWMMPRSLRAVSSHEPRRGPVHRHRPPQADQVQLKACHRATAPQK